MSTVSTHVLDTSIGKPAQGVKVTLERGADILGTAVTNSDGRVPEFPGGATLAEGAYRLRFLIEEYFQRDRRETLYSEITINFRIGSEGHYHLPLLLGPFGYSTYRGS